MKKSNVVKALACAAGMFAAVYACISCSNLTGSSSDSSSSSTSTTAASYTITYELDGGTNSDSNPSSYSAGTAVALASPTKTAFDFAGWYSDSAFTTAVTQITASTTGNLTLYAKWTATSYTITYELDSGTNSTSNPAAYTVTTDTITLANPTAAESRTDNVFAGWYSDSGFTTQVTSIAAGTTGNLTLYAKWAYTEANAVTAIGKLTADGCVIRVKDTLTDTTLAALAAAVKNASYTVGLDLAACTGVTEIADGEFSQNTKLISISIPGSVTTIGCGVFIECSVLTSVAIPSTVTSLGNAVFCHCGKLTSVTLPSSLTYLGNGSFCECSSLTALTIPEGVTCLDGPLFVNCTSISSIKIPSKVTKIESVFYGWTSSQTITLDWTSSDTTTRTLTGLESSSTNAKIVYSDGTAYSN